MSRSGYDEDYGEDYNNQIWLYRRSVDNALYGKRGQRMLRDRVAALDAMPEKRLITDELETETGAVCALGALGRARGVDMSHLNPEDARRVGRKFDIAESLALEVVYENDEAGPRMTDETPEQRWIRMRAWAESHLRAGDSDGIKISLYTSLETR